MRTILWWPIEDEWISPGEFGWFMSYGWVRDDLAYWYLDHPCSA